MEYLITKREVCPECNGSRIDPEYLDADGRKAITDGADLIPLRVPSYEPNYLCARCEDGYIETTVDILEVLSKLSWTENTRPLGDGTSVSDLHKMESPRIEE